MSLPGSAAPPAADRRRDNWAHRSGEAVVNLLRLGITARDILTKKAFENAIAVTMAFGGSTNAVLHLLAIAREAEVDLTLDDFNRIGDKIPHLGDLKPFGQYVMTDVDRVGGVPVVMKALLDAGLLHGDALTVTGKTVAENLEGINPPDPDGKIIRSLQNPIHKTGGITILKGSMAPEGAVVKTAGFDAATFDFDDVAARDHELMFRDLAALKTGRDIVIAAILLVVMHVIATQADRATLKRLLDDRNGGLAELQAGVEENILFAQAIDAAKAKGSEPYLVEAHIGAHAPFTVPDEVYADWNARAKGYAAEQGWKVEAVSINASDIGGFKEVIANVTGTGVFAKLKFESGVHRVQRVPVTESGGRIHTSAATVAVLPEAEEVDVAINDSDLKIDTYRASGAGGQHVNTTDSAIRITHIPTGLVVIQQDQRSQHKNRAKAMQVLRARLYDLERAKIHDAEASARKSMVGSGDRSERIRTYNFPQGRVTDHRINLTLHRLPEILEGVMDELIDALIAEDQAQRLAGLGD